jgi:hypothetical protein
MKGSSQPQPRAESESPLRTVAHLEDILRQREEVGFSFGDYFEVSQFTLPATFEPFLPLQLHNLKTVSSKMINKCKGNRLSCKCGTGFAQAS